MTHLIAVRIECCIVSRSIGRVAGHIRNRRAPAGERVGVLGRRSLGRSRTLVLRCYSCCQSFILQLGAIFVHKFDCIFLDFLPVTTNINITPLRNCYGSNNLAILLPTSEHITIHRRNIRKRYLSIHFIFLRSRKRRSAFDLVPILINNLMLRFYLFEIGFICTGRPNTVCIGIIINSGRDNIACLAGNSCLFPVRNHRPVLKFRISIRCCLDCWGGTSYNCHSSTVVIFVTLTSNVPRSIGLNGNGCCLFSIFALQFKLCTGEFRINRAGCTRLHFLVV